VPSLTRRIAANTLVQVAGRAAGLVAGFASVALLTRELGEDGYGRYGLALGYATLFAVVADAGLFTILVREASRTPERTRRLVGVALTVRLVLSVVLVGAAVAVSFLLPYDGTLRLAILLAGAGVAVNLLANTVIAVFNARLRMERAVAAQVLGRIAQIAAIVAVVTGGLGLLGAVGATVVAAVVTLAVCLVLARGIVRVRPAWDPAEARALLVASLPLGVTLAVNEVYFRADTLIISLSRTFGEVGEYTLAYRVLELVVAFPAVFVGTVFPVVSQLVDTDPVRLRAVVQRAWDALVAVAVPLAVGGFAVAPGLVALTAGSGFAGAVTPLRLLLVAGALITVNSLLGFTIIAAGRQLQALWLNVGVLTVNLALNAALVPAYGIDAAAAVTVGCELALLAGGLLLLRRFLGFVPGPRMLPRALLAAVPTFAVAWALRDTFVLVPIAAGALVYVLALAAVGGVDRAALADLRRP
jgi:O-antigen/teichoic acid export membrane protein